MSLVPLQSMRLEIYSRKKVTVSCNKSIKALSVGRFSALMSSHFCSGYSIIVFQAYAMLPLFLASARINIEQSLYETIIRLGMKKLQCKFTECQFIYPRSIVLRSWRESSRTISYDRIITFLFLPV